MFYDQVDERTVIYLDQRVGNSSHQEECQKNLRIVVQGLKDNHVYKSENKYELWRIS